jgi:proteasome lid subunit RPN8/RPN11
MDNLTAPERGIWVSATGKVRVEYPHRVLEEIRAATVQGLCRFPRGGLEVGGVLLGSVRDGVVRVIAARPVECSYARGPSFTLTEGDEAAFRKMMAGGGADLKAVGWYHSHTRSDLSFSLDDAAVHERLFPEPWHFALVVRPEPFGSAEAAFFARGDGGVMEPVPHGALLLRPAARLKPSGYGARRTVPTDDDAEDVVPPMVQVLELETPPEPEPATV